MSNNKTHSSVYYDEQADRIQNNRERNVKRENSVTHKADGNRRQERISSKVQREGYRKSEAKIVEHGNAPVHNEKKSQRKIISSSGGVKTQESEVRENDRKVCHGVLQGPKNRECVQIKMMTDLLP